MRKKSILAAMLILSIFMPLAAAEKISGNWHVAVLDDKNLALTVDYSDFLQQEYLRSISATSILQGLPGAKKFFNADMDATSVILRHRPRFNRDLQQFDKIRVNQVAGPAIAVTSTGYWLNPIGQTGFKNNKNIIERSRNADVAHYLFITLATPLQPNHRYEIHVNTGEIIAFTYEPDKQISPLFKHNQLGYMPGAARKIIYLGAWRGSAGPLDLSQYIGKKFQIHDAANGKEVASGTVSAAIPDAQTKGGVPLTGEMTLQLDISQLQKPGEYFATVPGIGRSANFRIDNSTMQDAFYCHMRGLYHKRCGIAKSAPYTAWTVGSCHNQVMRGSFPPHDGHYIAAQAGKERQFGFVDELGRSINVRHFQLIKNNTPKNPEILHIAGGWHDAADFDRREQHLNIVNELCAAFLLKPENFSDRQLDIPESGNGIPDILDEAVWGLEHLRRTQLPNGGVGTWIETDHHPKEHEFLPSDDRTIFQISLPTRNSTLCYAASAAMLANALKKSGAEKQAALWAASARSAWNFAMDEKNRVIRKPYQYYDQKNVRTIFYTDSPNLPPEFLVKAAGNLALYFSDKSYLQPLVPKIKELSKQLERSAYRRSPLSLIELIANAPALPELKVLLETEKKQLLRNADAMQKRTMTTHSYLNPWYGATDKKFGDMGWGNAHPLRQALVLLAAWGLTGQKEYLSAAYLANDFHNGGNPLGMSMTSGLGRIYPVRFLDLTSYADNIAEFVPGITPYGNIFKIPYADAVMAHGLYFPRYYKFPGCAVSLLPQTLTGRRELSQKQHTALLNKTWPIWRRAPNIEGHTVPVSEYTVSDTIGPAAAATALMIAPGGKVSEQMRQRRPAEDIRQLPGYAPLP